MISNTLGKKWISEETEEEEELFNHCREMELVCYAVTKVVLDADNKWQGAGGTSNTHSLSNRKYIMELVNIQVSCKCCFHCGLHGDDCLMIHFVVMVVF